MTGETLQQIHRRLGLPDIPQELIDKAKQQHEDHQRRMSDPEVRARLLAHNKALLARFGKQD